MPNCRSVETKAFPIRQVRSVNHSLVPWEVKGYFDDYEASRGSLSFFDLSNWEILKITGPDAADYLHRMSTANIKGLAVGKVDYLAFLTGRANPVVFGYVKRETPSDFCLIFPAGQGTLASAHIEKFHFAENFSVTPAPELSLAALWIPQKFQAATTWLDLKSAPMECVSTQIEDIPLVYWRDDVRPSLIWATMKTESLEDFWSVSRAEGGNLLGQRLFEYFRIRSGIPEVGKELSDKEIFLEGNFEQGVARNKGCYPGQEVIERIFTYGQVNKKLLAVELVSSGPFPPAPYALQHQDKTVGNLVSYSEHPENPHQAIGLAYVGKSFWELKDAFSAPQGISGHLTPPAPK